MIQLYPAIDSIEQCLDALIDFALENRKAVLHIYNSVNRDLYERYQWRVCRYVVEVYLDGVLWRTAYYRTGPPAVDLITFSASVLAL